MSKIERIAIIVLLAICAISLTFIAYNGYQTASLEQARAAQVADLRGQITKSLADIDAVNTAYQKNAYENIKVDTISKQQLIAAEATNALLSHLSAQIVLLAQIVK